MIFAIFFHICRIYRISHICHIYPQQRRTGDFLTGTYGYIISPTNTAVRHVFNVNWLKMIESQTNLPNILHFDIKLALKTLKN